jgi:hypothetical protein
MLPPETNTPVISGAVQNVLPIIGILLLIGFLIQKEILSNSNNQRLRKLSELLNLAIFPLLIVFLFVLAINLVQALK